MGAGALTICHHRAAVHIKEDMKRMAQLPLIRAKAPEGREVFGVPLPELAEAGMLRDGVPLPVRTMVEFLREHALQQEGLFRVNGNVRAVEGLRLRFESGGGVDLQQEGDVCTVASLLKQFLRDLPGGVITAAAQTALLQLHQECGGDQSRAMKEILQQLHDLHYNLLKYLCLFLTQVESCHQDNRMTALNLATVFGPNVFHVSPGFDGITEQTLCNKIMVKLIQNYSAIFESDVNPEDPKVNGLELIAVKEAHGNRVELRSPGTPASKVSTPKRKKAALSTQTENVDSVGESATEILTATSRKKQASQSTKPESMEELTTEVPTPTPRKKKAARSTQLENLDPVEESGAEVLTATPRKKKVRKVRSEEESRALPRPVQSEGLPQLRRPVPRDRNREDVDISNDEVTADRATQGLSSLQESERPISPFYMSSPFSASHRNTDSALFLEWTIRLAVEQHLFASQVGSGSAQSPGLAERSSNVAMTTTQRCPQLKDQDEIQECKDTYERFCESRAHNKNRGTENMASSAVRRGHPEKDSGLSPQSSAMKIQEIPGSRGSRMGDVEGCEEHPGRTQNSSWGDDSPVFTVPVLDFKTICQQSYYGDPVPVDGSWQREGMDGEEARVSPHTGGRLIQELLGEDSDPMLSPRSYGYGHCRQYLDDTEVPPSPPNAHSFMSRRRSSSLGSCDEEKVELSAAQLSKKINSLKKKINRFEDKFQEERKYRPSHSDKAGNPEVLHWMNELSKLRKELKEHKLLKSEEDLPPMSRPRSNTLPKSFGSQLDRETKEVRKEVKEQEEVEKEPVESTLEAVQKKLQERREEEGRPEDIKDMTREQIGAEKVALQKALLYYENIHGRPVSKAERQIMKPLYDRYRLIKQILCRASTIPIIGSPSSKRRGLLLQPIIEGEPSLFFDEIKEEEEGSEDDGDSQTQSSGTFRPELSMLGFSLAIDELAPSKNSTDTRLSNLHSATMQELVEQLQEAREEKKKIRKNLREFEDQFFRENGRNVQKEDRTPLAQEYNEYKHLKAKLRLLEVLISKRDSSKFI